MREVKNNRQKTAWIENNTEKKLKEFKDLVENKEKRKGTAWSKERKRKHAEMIRRYWDKRKEEISVVLKGSFVKKKNIRKLGSININILKEGLNFFFNKAHFHVFS